jgi:DNA-directed RNA polymerase III subunit RPC1
MLLIDLQPLELWTGKQIFSVLIRPNYKSHVLVNLETASKNYSGGKEYGDRKIPYLCRNDGCIQSYFILIVCSFSFLF